MVIEGIELIILRLLLWVLSCCSCGYLANEVGLFIGIDCIEGSRGSRMSEEEEMYAVTLWGGKG